jgi:hypothetical protein
VDIRLKTPIPNRNVQQVNTNWEVHKKMPGSEKIREFARNEIVTAVARGVQLIGIPLGLLFLAWLAGSVNAINIQIPQMIAEQRASKEIFDVRFNYTSKDLDAMKEQIRDLNRKAIPAERK